MSSDGGPGGPGAPGGPSDRPRAAPGSPTPQRPIPRTPAGVAAVPGGPLPPRKRPCLLLLAGPRMGELIPVESQGVVIGRDPQADLVLLEEGVSRRHARVVVEGSVVRLIDLGSTN